MKEGHFLERVALGLTMHSVSRIGVGLAALGRPGYINIGHSTDLKDGLDIESMRQRAHSVLDVAWESGVRYFDVARSYGRAEEFLGSWLVSRGIPRESVTVGSKWGYTYTADWKVQLPPGERHEIKDHSLPVLDRQTVESREILGEYLDVYQIHSATIESGVLSNGEVLSRLAELRDAGTTIGFSVSGPRQSDTIRRGLEIERNGRPLFEAVQATWNLLEQSATDALSEAHAQGRGIIVKEALANGRLTPRAETSILASNPQLGEFAKENEVTLDAIAIAAAMHQPWSSVVLSGAATIEHLQSNLAAVKIDVSKLTGLVQFAEPSETYWQNRAGLAWN